MYDSNRRAGVGSQLKGWRPVRRMRSGCLAGGAEWLGEERGSQSGWMLARGIVEARHCRPCIMREGAPAATHCSTRGLEWSTRVGTAATCSLLLAALPVAPPSLRQPRRMLTAGSTRPWCPRRGGGCQ